MAPYPFSYAGEKLHIARGVLMLPHLNGEAESIAEAFHNCSLGLEDIDESKLDDNAREWVATIRRLMDTSGVTSSDGTGLWKVKAEQLTVDDKIELSRAVDELASHFDMGFWSHDAQSHP